MNNEPITGAELDHVKSLSDDQLVEMLASFTTTTNQRSLMIAINEVSARLAVSEHRKKELAKADAKLARAGT